MTRDDTGVVAALRRGLIVSCQAEGDDPFNAPELVACFARAAEMGGAVAIRTRDPANVRAIRRATQLPIVGLTKGRYADGRVLITPDLADVDVLIEAGADLVAVDATFRRRPNGMTGSEFVARVSERSRTCIVADVSTLEEGVAAFRGGAAAVATTLSGYTEETEGRDAQGPDWALLTALIGSALGRVILEGRVWTPTQARRGLELGAFAVVVGTAITRPRAMTERFVQAMR